jgi:hypothetical protein
MEEKKDTTFVMPCHYDGELTGGIEDIDLLYKSLPTYWQVRYLDTFFKYTEKDSKEHLLIFARLAYLSACTTATQTNKLTRSLLKLIKLKKQDSILSFCLGMAVGILLATFLILF